MQMARTAAASGPGDPFAVDEDAALAELELAWSDAGYHAFSADGGTWCTVSSAGEVLIGDTPDELDRAIRGHWAGSDRPGRAAPAGRRRPGGLDGAPPAVRA